MNRPDRKDYVVVEWANEKSYISDLEKYCDELERKIKLKEYQRQNWEHDYKGIESYYKDCLAQREKVLIEWSNECHEAWNELEKFKRALNKVCKLLAGGNDGYSVSVFTFDRDGYDVELDSSEEQWKEWALQDE